MPALVEVELVGSAIPALHPVRLHGAACSVLLDVPGPHDGADRPFSVWPVWQLADGLRWRLGWLADRPARLAPRVRFGRDGYAVRAHQSGQAYGALAALAPARAARLVMQSPTYFRRNRRDHPLPEPGLVLQSLARRWDAFAPAALSVPTPRLTELIGTVFVDELDGRTVRAPASTDREQTGFVGSVTFALVRSATDEQRRLFAALMRYAEFAGIGAQTTHGFGAVEVELR